MAYSKGLDIFFICIRFTFTPSFSGFIISASTRLRVESPNHSTQCWGREERRRGGREERGRGGREERGRGRGSWGEERGEVGKGKEGGGEGERGRGECKERRDEMGGGGNGELVVA